MNGFIASLLAPAAAHDRATAMETYGWLVGDWRFTGRVFVDGQPHAADGGQIHAAWVLEGRAIQDVWRLPGFFVGTTLRVYDPGIDAWHIVWSDPLRQHYGRQLGRRVGANLVQEGTDLQGAATRWSFVDIATDRFRWLGEKRTTDGPWQLVAEFAARRE